MGRAGAEPTPRLAISAPPHPCPQQRFQDTSQYVCAELQALEQEQRQIDGRAAEVETQLRGLMESGGVGAGAPFHQCPPSCSLWEGLAGGTPSSISPPAVSKARCDTRVSCRG